MLFLELLKKELKENRVRMIVLGGLLLLWQLFLLQRLNAWGMEIVGVIAVSTGFLLPLLMAILNLQGLHGEWKNKTFYLLGAMPVRFSTIVFAKLVAVLLEVLAYSLITSINIFNFFRLLWDQTMIIPPPLAGYSSAALVTRQVLFVLAVFLVMLLATGALANWSLIMGRLVPRFNWLLSLGMFFTGGWLVMRLTQGLAPLFNWLPQVIMVGQGSSGGIPHYYLTYLKPGPLLLILFVSLGLLALAAYIFERYLEY